MTRLEFFAWCAFLSIAALAWLAVGVPGTLCLIAGAIVGNIDLGWIEAEDDARRSQSPGGEVSAVPHSDTGGSDRELAVPLQTTSVPLLLKPRRRTWVKARKLPANVVLLKPRKVS